MDLDTYVAPVIAFVRDNAAWAPPIVFALAFGESLAFISLLLPATMALFGIGALIGVSGIAFIPIFLAAACGAALGDWLSFWIGETFKEPIAKVWPLSRYQDMLPRGPFDHEMRGLISGPGPACPCAAGTHKAYLPGIIPPLLTESTLTLSVAADAAGANASCEMAKQVPSAIPIDILPIMLFPPSVTASRCWHSLTRRLGLASEAEHVSEP